MTKKYDKTVFILRGQPIHNAHVEILRIAQKISDQVIVIFGSGDQPRTYKNPFLAKERIQILRDIVAKDDEINNVVMEYTFDSIYNDSAWVIRIQEIVAKYSSPGDKIALVGHEKDESSFYLKMFPQWDLHDIDQIEILNSTNIRELYFKESFNMNYIKGVLPQATFEFLSKFRDTEDFKRIVEEREFIEKYKQQFQYLPFPPVFVTTDAVIVQSGHVLMVKRKSKPGKGLYALPGGFLDANKDKSMKDCMIRELREETKIKVPVPVLIGNIKGNAVFDAPNRSLRGRTITHAFFIQLPDGELPKVRGSDDAEKAKWIPISEIDRSICFEDHAEIISHFIGA